MIFETYPKHALTSERLICGNTSRISSIVSPAARYSNDTLNRDTRPVDNRSSIADRRIDYDHVSLIRSRLRHGNYPHTRLSLDNTYISANTHVSHSFHHTREVSGKGTFTQGHERQSPPCIRSQVGAAHPNLPANARRRYDNCKPVAALKSSSKPTSKKLVTTHNGEQRCPNL